MKERTRKIIVAGLLLVAVCCAGYLIWYYSMAAKTKQSYDDAKKLAKEKGLENEFALYDRVERLAKEEIMTHRKMFKPVCANVDFYSGFVYSMLDLPLELYTPMFAVARIVGWSAHRMEELINTDKIIRPAYKNVLPEAEYIPLSER